MNILIIEDEKIAAQRLCDMLCQVVPQANILPVLDSVESCFNYFDQPQKKADLIFMDIQLSDGKSFDVLDKVTIESPVIFITAYQEHALHAFKMNSVDYLLKPLKKDDLKNAVQKYEKYHGGAMPGITAKIATALHELKQQHNNLQRRFLAKCGTRLMSIPCDQVAFFYTKEKFQFIKTVNNEDFIIDKRLDELETELSDKDFFRANRQFIISYGSIEKVHAWFSGKLKVQVRPSSYEEIIVSRLRSADFKKWLGD